MSDNNGKNGARETARKAAKAASTTKQTIKAGSKIASGNVAGGIKEAMKDDNLRMLIIAVSVFILCIPIMMFSLVPTVLFFPTEDAYGNDANASTVSLMDILKGLFGGGADEAFNNPFSTVAYAADGDEDTDNPEIENMVTNGLKNKNTALQVVADSETTFTDFDTAPDNASETMRDIIKITQDRLEKRHKKLKAYVKKDYDIRKTHYSCDNVTYVIDDPMTSGTSTIGKETIRLTALYSVQHDENVTDQSLDDYLSWLGDKRFFETLTADDAEGYDSWYYKPKRWYGTMLPQKQMDEERDAKARGTYNRSDFEDYYTSALAEMFTLDSTVDIDEAYEHDDETDTDVLMSVKLTYKIKSLTVDEICSNIVKFDEAIKTDSDGNPLIIGVELHREELYREMVGEGEGEGVALKYFSEALNTGYSSGSGSGMDIVRVAQGEIGTVETPENYVKYNDWYYGSHRGGGDVPWCCAFVAWCAEQCGYIESGIIPRTAGCSGMNSFYSAKGRKYMVTDSSFTPQPGDFIIKGGDQHIGIVEKYENGILYTIEGNSGPGISDVSDNGGCVAEHAYGEGQSQSIVSRWLSSGYYCRPEYPMSASSGDAALICWMYETGGGVYGQYNLWMHEMLSGEGFYNYGAMSTNKSGADALFNYIKSHSSNFSTQIGSKDRWANTAKTDMCAEFNRWWTGSHSDADNQEMFELQSGYLWSMCCNRHIFIYGKK